MAKTKPLPSLADAPWLHQKNLQQVMAALSAEGEVRVAGGAVRNSLLGVAVADVDLATTLQPDAVMRIARAARFGVHPTGVEHGTVTLSHHGAAFEVTTLRRDVETDGRRAVVSFTDNWAEDAQRRDFTMNAMYCDAAGKIYDFTNGYEDLLKRKVRFVGSASQRIREDYLRVLRFFRFHAQYGRAAPDEAGLRACTRLKPGLRQLSAERVRQELLKLLQAPRAVATLKVMAAHGILKVVLPHTEEWRVLGRLPADGILRLAVLALQPTTLKDSLRLSNAEAARIAALAAVPRLSPALNAAEQRRMLYMVGTASWADAVYLNWAQSRAALDDPDWQTMLALPAHWPVPVFPVTGGDLKQAGMASGPGMGKVLRALEDWWVASDFKPEKDELLIRSKRYEAN